MKNNTFLVALKMLFGIDIILGVIAGTATATFILWFLMGGGVLIFPFTAIVIYIIIFIITLIFGGFKFGYKAVWITMLSFSLGWFAFLHIYKVACGANPKDIKVMKPMAKAISEYIVKNGIPKKLSEIPGLPYKLHIEKENRGFYYFKVSNDKYIVYQKARDMLEFQAQTKRGNGYTWLWLIYKIDKKGHYTLDKKEFFLAHRSGICSSMKQ